MKDHYLFDDTGIDYSKGRYIVFDRGTLVAQNDDLGVALEVARAKKVPMPAVIDLEIMREDYIHVY